jgi:hypothetical protein
MVVCHFDSQKPAEKSIIEDDKKPFEVVEVTWEEQVPGALIFSPVDGFFLSLRHPFE